MFKYIEPIDYYSSRRIVLPVKSEGLLKAYVYSNQMSVAIFFIVVILKIFGKKVYFLPDGIFEIANAKRRMSLLGRFAGFFIDGVLCGDDISFKLVEYYGGNPIKIERWCPRGLKSGCGKKNSDPHVILTVANTPFFTKEEKIKLEEALEGFDGGGAIVETCYTIAGDKIKPKKIVRLLASLGHGHVVVSTVSTIIIEAALRGIKTSVLAFRGYEKEAGLRVWPEIYDKSILYAGTEEWRECVNISSRARILYQIENMIKKVVKRVFSLL